MGSRIAVIGTGYVGLTTGACLAHMGHDVVCVDVDAGKVERLNRGEIPILEDGLDQLVLDGRRSGRLSFTLGAAEAVKDREFVYLCVPTPQGDDGSADLSYIEAAAREIGPHLERESIVINKSTVPVGSTRVVEQALQRGDVSVVSNPEFLREGSAVHDFLHPDRVVIGAADQAAAIRMAGLYIGLTAPIMVTDPASAETIKYASNAFLATKISFVNAVAAVCEAVGADVNDVVLGMGYDKRIGQEFLRPGPGWGGSCFVGSETVVVRVGETVRMRSLRQVVEDASDSGIGGLEVLSWAWGDPTPEFFPVSCVTARRYTGDVVEIRTRMGRRLTVTADHPMVVGDGRVDTTPEVVLAEDLGAGHWLPAAVGLPLPAGDPIRTTSILDAASRSCIDDANGTVSNGTYVPDSIPVEADFWRMVGLYLAEGFITRDGSRERIFWTFHPDDEMELVDWLVDYWGGLGVTASVHRSPTSRRVSISSRLLAAWFRELGVGDRSYVKRVPDAIWTAPVDHRWSLLRGLWDGDGSWSFGGRGNNAVLEYGTVSRALADGMLRLLASLGVIASQRVGRGAKSTVDTHWLRISGADQIEVAAPELLPAEEWARIRARGLALRKRIAPTGFRPDGKNAAWLRVTSAVRRSFDGTVYSLEVPGTHTIVTTGGLVAHNCFPKDTIALIRIAEDAGYDFRLLKGVKEVNDQQFERVTQKVIDAAGGSVAGKRVAGWGITFKARTDDTRMSPAIEILKRLQAAGAVVTAFDPAIRAEIEGIPVAENGIEACRDAEVLVVLTEWDEFKWIDLDQVAAVMAAPRIVDARNLLDSGRVRQLGFSYQGIGRT